MTLLSGELFAQCPVDSFPGGAVEAVVDSSRFFVLRLEDSNGIILLHSYQISLICMHI